MNGKVKFYLDDKGYGFIEGDDGQDYFLHRSALPDNAYPKKDDKVSFETEITDRGNKAIKLKFAEA